MNINANFHLWNCARSSVIFFRVCLYRLVGPYSSCHYQTDLSLTNTSGTTHHSLCPCRDKLDPHLVYPACQSVTPGCIATFLQWKLATCQSGHSSVNRKSVAATVPKSHCCQGLYSLSNRVSYLQIAWRLETTSYTFRVIQSLWNVIGVSVSVLLWCLSLSDALLLKPNSVVAMVHAIWL